MKSAIARRWKEKFPLKNEWNYTLFGFLLMLCILIIVPLIQEQVFGLVESALCEPMEVFELLTIEDSKEYNADKRESGNFMHKTTRWMVNDDENERIRNEIYMVRSVNLALQSQFNQNEILIYKRSKRFFAKDLKKFGIIPLKRNTISGILDGEESIERKKLAAHLQYHSPSAKDLDDDNAAEIEIELESGKQDVMHLLELEDRSILEDQYYIRYIDGVRGYGLFASRDLPANTILDEFLGEVGVSTVNSFSWEYPLRYNESVPGSFLVISAKRAGNSLRFIQRVNISDNCIPFYVIHGGQWRLFVRLHRNVPQDAQFFVFTH